ncbi:hypothetical protein [Streptomyces sp. NPDC096033]|uniref:hypothetical protein n=1 Tax=Streptomyces sp. NPDC096033 TaxID=3366071 RepID=UPI0037F8BC0F
MTEMLARPVEAAGAGQYRNPRDFAKPEVWDREVALLMRECCTPMGRAAGEPGAEEVLAGT